MTIVQDYIDRLQKLASDRQELEASWMEEAIYALPNAERFDRLFGGGSAALSLTMEATVHTPVTAKRSREIFDQTSLWAVDRGANGTISLVTPESSPWHDVGLADVFAGEPSHDEELFFDALRDYLFATRYNPRSGFAAANKACVRGMWGFGTSVMFVARSKGGRSWPISYRYLPLSENHLATNFEDVVDTNYRLFILTARQAVGEFGTRMSSIVQDMADEPKQMDKPITILHAVQPRTDRFKSDVSGTMLAADFESVYIEPDKKHIIARGGFEEFPYMVYQWSKANPGPYAEGPLAIAIADIKSVNMLAKHELMAAQQWVSPPYASMGGTKRPNLNPNAPNPGLLDDNGNLKIKPIVMQQRPDLAAEIINVRRDQIRQTLYIDLWQSIINSQREQTAFEVMIKNQEKGDLLGPVGSSMQAGLSMMFDREIGILVRRGAFESGSPLEPPDSLRGQEPAVQFTSPLDKLRKLPQLQGLTQLAGLTAQIAQFDPGVRHKIDWDEAVDLAAEILDVPARVLVAEDVLRRARLRDVNTQNAAAGIEMARAGGEAAQSAGAGVEALAQSPASRDIIANLAGVAGL